MQTGLHKMIMQGSSFSKFLNIVFWTSKNNGSCTLAERSETRMYMKQYVVQFLKKQFTYKWQVLQHLIWIFMSMKSNIRYLDNWVPAKATKIIKRTEYYKTECLSKLFSKNVSAGNAVCNIFTQNRLIL